jgi:Ser/Thr protein kinase RdoA (MazF antagonist)
MKDSIVLLEDNAREVLSYWDLRAGDWEVTGVVTSGPGGIARPIVAISGQWYVLRRQPADLTENDTIFRQAYMRHLKGRGLPVPDLLPRPDGHTYVVVADGIDGIYELQEWLDGARYVTGSPDDADWTEAAAITLALLHQASADFAWHQHTRSEERSGAGIAQAYVELIRERAEDAALPQTVRDGLARAAKQCVERLGAALEALEAEPRPPELHLHGDYQPHNLAFGLPGVTALYDFDAARWERRIDEVAYSLLFFAGVHWDEQPTVTPPLADDGLDILRAHRYLSAYGQEAPPAESEARLLADALALAFPVVLANGVAEDLVFTEDFAEPPDEEDALRRLHWADTFWLWLDRYRDTLAQAWEGA